VNAPDARALFAAARVAHLATADARGRPHLVPIAFALLGADMIVSAVDHKPKRTTALRRLANVAANPAVAVLVDHYSDDWDQLWWARADGRGRVLEPSGDSDEPQLRAAAVGALSERYSQYRERPPAGAVLAIEVTRWSAWRARR
jgi:PPOX class probable F420-dependent enzyme